MCLVTQSCQTLCIPIDCSPPGSSVHGYSSGKNTGVGCHALLQGLPNPGIKPRSPTSQADSMLSEPPATDLINYACVTGAFLVEDSIKNQTKKKRIGRASRLVNQNTSTCPTEWPQTPGGWKLLCQEPDSISSSGYWFLSVNILCNKQQFSE